VGGERDGEGKGYISTTTLNAIGKKLRENREGGGEEISRCRASS